MTIHYPLSAATTAFTKRLEAYSHGTKFGKIRKWKMEGCINTLCHATKLPSYYTRCDVSNGRSTNAIKLDHVRAALATLKNSQSILEGSDPKVAQAITKVINKPMQRLEVEYAVLKQRVASESVSQTQQAFELSIEKAAYGSRPLRR